MEQGIVYEQWEVKRLRYSLTNGKINRECSTSTKGDSERDDGETTWTTSRGQESKQRHITLTNGKQEGWPTERSAYDDYQISYWNF